uniref:AB hydrolase-1 domain-containing protein n=1 Tax=Rhodosorus marinus TaxID=101924 RepID=A0A7S3A868_9RHOD|mmetsp:Transcript_5269/g.22397  ORF Transcript_5269/g.22397 Transcript_5269/m.22397 type:complete len:235 (+) Transcript_5269:611-1315(+)
MAGISVERVNFASEDGTSLEAKIYHDRTGMVADGRRSCVLVVHPHPKLGGTFDNPVVVEMALSMVEEGGMGMCLNMRGVGRSGGSSSWKGDKEVKDVAAAVKFLKARDDVGPVYLVGYSFGACIVATAMLSVRDLVDGISLLSPPWGRISSIMLGHHFKNESLTGQIPKMVVAGTDDMFSSQSAFKRHFEALPEPKTKLLVNRASHFWVNEEQKATTPIAKFFSSLDAARDERK